MKHEELLSKLTPEEKAALLSGKTVWQTRDIPRLKIPSIFLSDGPHGIRKQAGAGDHLGLNASLKATCFPTAATIANSWDPWGRDWKSTGRRGSSPGCQYRTGTGA